MPHIVTRFQRSTSVLLLVAIFLFLFSVVMAKLMFCCVKFVPRPRTSVHQFDVDVASCFPVVKLLLVPLVPKTDDARRKARFQALATDLALDNGALSALHREKKKADHTLHDHATLTICSEDCPGIVVLPAGILNNLFFVVLLGINY